MRRSACTLLVCTSVLLACQDNTGLDPTGPAAAALAISDAAHDGREGFYFLPPLVPDPGPAGDFDPSVLPGLGVEVCEWDGSTCVGAMVAEFSAAAGTGSEVLRIGDDGEHYIVNWHTDLSGLDPNKTYRLRVLKEEVVLGFADLDIVSSGKELKNVDTGEYVALKDGRTLPVKFWISVPVIDAAPIIFGSDRGGNFDIYAINPDGTGLENLTNNPAYDDGPLWSPDGTKIAFTTDRFAGNSDVAILDLASGLVSRVTSDPLIEVPLDWAPDGQSLAMLRHNGNDNDLFLVNIDGSGLVQLTSGSASDGPALFSPDGQSIVFRSDPPGFANTNLFRIDLDGSNQTLIMNWRFTDGIAWSPDGNSLYVTGQEALGTPFDIYRLDLAGNILTRLTTDPAFELAPTVSPDGNTLLFASERTGDWDLYQLDLITSALTPLAPSPGTTEVQSDWRR